MVGRRGDFLIPLGIGEQKCGISPVTWEGDMDFSSPAIPTVSPPSPDTHFVPSLTPSHPVHTLFLSNVRLTTELFKQLLYLDPVR